MLFLLVTPDDILNSIGIFHTVCIRIISLVFGSVAVLIFIGIANNVLENENDK
jgi:hypothetical protein